MQEAFASVEHVYHNPGGRVLRLIVGLACNVDDEVVYANVAANAKKHPGNWVKQVPAHGDVAIICGSGPSLADNLELIRHRQREGGKVFALNGAAAFLWRNDILPDYQVIMDARPETAALVGPARAHLFASQVDPMCFQKRPAAQLWHSTHGEWVPEFPDYEGDYSVICGSATVGNTAPVLVYAMGYREIHIFGLDSSNKGVESHAFHQPLNDTDAFVVTEFEGKRYVSSHVMELQSRLFPARARQLEAAGCAIHVYGDGLLPARWRSFKSEADERGKYESVWEREEYRLYSPGEKAVARFLEIEPERGAIVDIGCGTGRAALRLKDGGFAPILVDLAENARDEAAKMMPFHRLDLVRDPLPPAKFGFCADVMEHLPTRDVTVALKNVFAACDKVFFQISTVPDGMGTLVGKQLHLTVKPYQWWLAQFGEAGARILYEEDAGETVFFYAACP